MIRKSGLVIFASFFLVMFAIAQWQLLGSVFDHYFALLTIGLAVAGISFGVALSGYVVARLKEKDTFQCAAIFFSLSALMAVAGFLVVYLISLGSLPVFLLLLVIFLLPWILASVAFMFLAKGNAGHLLPFSWLAGSAVALSSGSMLIEYMQSPVLLVLVASAGLAVTAIIFSSRPLMPLVLVSALVLPGLVVYFSGSNPSLSPAWSEDAIKLAKPLYIDLKATGFASPPVTHWSEIGRTDKLVYKNEEGIRWLVTNAAFSVPVIEQAQAVSWWKARFPLMALPLLLGEPQTFLSIGAIAASELAMAEQFGVSSVYPAAYNQNAITSDSRKQRVAPRRVIETIPKDYDLVFVPLLQLTRGSSTFSNLEDSYLYTAESFRRYYDKLAPGGMMVVTAIDPRLFFKTIYTAWEGIGGDIRSRTWGIQAKSNLPLQAPYRFAFILTKEHIPLGFVGKMKELANTMPVNLLFGPGINPIQPFELLLRIGTDGLEKGRAVLTRFLSQRSHEWLDLEPVTDDRPFLFQLMRKLDMQQKWVMGLGAAGLIFCFLFAVSALRRADSSLHAEFAPIPIYLGYFAIHGAVMVGIAVAMLWRSIMLLGFSGTGAIIVLLPWLAGIALAVVIGRKFVFNANQNLLNIILPLTVITLLGVSFTAVTTYAVSLMGWSYPLAGLVIVLVSFSLGFVMSLSFGYGLNKLSFSLPDIIDWAWAGFGFAALIGVVLVVLLGKMWGWSGLWFVAAIGYLLIMGMNFWLWRGDTASSSGEVYG